MEKNPNNLVLFKGCDYKDSLDLEDHQALLDHAKKIDGDYRELNVYTADENIFYSGPKGIENWLGTGCAFEMFCDNTFVIDRDEEDIAEVEEIYYYPDTNEVWVSLNVYKEPEPMWMSYQDLLNFKKINEPDW